jgi:ubiquinone/menaquinone biosynthesis C-methylase UbiE
MDKKNQNFNWSGHIKDLNDFPDIGMLWEKHFVSSVLKIIPKNKKTQKVLEVGCSNGRWLRWFNREYNCEVFGVDNNPEGFKKNDIVNFKLGDCKKLPFSNESFDLVFSLGLVEHFTKKEKVISLKEQCRVLNKGGFLICLVPLLSFSLSFLYVKLNYDFRKGFKHFRTTKKEIENYFKEMGIEIICSKTIGNIFESLIGIGKLNNLLKNKLLAKILATEILVIGKKI